MVGNALLRSGVQINFWQSKAEGGEDLHPVPIDQAGIWTSGLPQKMYVRTAIVGLTKQLDQRHQVL
jgi:hypothetical protein